MQRLYNFPAVFYILVVTTNLPPLKSALEKGRQLYDLAKSSSQFPNNLSL
jgi:hypothetical protein